MTIDPSGRGRDETAVVVASGGNGYVFIHEVIGFEGGHERRGSRRSPRSSRVSAVYDQVRENFGDGMFGNLLRPSWRALSPVPRHRGVPSPWHEGGQNHQYLEPVMGSHRLVFSPQTVKAEATQRQLTRLYNERGALARRPCRCAGCYRRVLRGDPGPGRR